MTSIESRRKISLIVTVAAATVFLAVSCGQRMNMSSFSQAQLQRNSNMSGGEPQSQAFPQNFASVEGAGQVAGIDSSSWTAKEISGAAAQKNADGKIRPDRSYRSIWVHIFPVFNTHRAYSSWAKRMPSPDPYEATKDPGLIRIRSEFGFKIAKLKTGDVLGEGRDLTVSLGKKIISLDGTEFPLEDIYVDTDSTDIVQVLWDKESNNYRGGFVITAEDGPTDKPVLRLVNVVDFESYVMDVVPGEMPGDYPEEALKVQAVAARTYALNKMLAARCDYDSRSKECRRSEPAPFDVFANTQDQLYMGIAKESARGNSAVRATAGQVVVYDGQVIFAMFHANSGGRTCSYSDCYGGNHIPYLISKVEPDKESLRKIPGGANHTSFSGAALAKALRANGIKFKDNEVISFTPSVRNGSERTVEAVARGATDYAVIPQEILYKLRGEFEIATSYIGGSERKSDGKLTVTSYGWGHGVGISQEGARLQAERGRKYTDIISFYYDKTQLVDLHKISKGI